jgi:hypothetical protein
VLEKKPGPDPKVGSDTSAANGKYEVEEKNADGRYYAKAAESTVGVATCLAAKSAPVNVG